ncbi:MAG TPA: lmo0937 family membrane protein [Chthoniobacterales bacterium]|nr:lmo0937 family membrane protein [Chthoniobacterales bacterium]
MPEYLACCFGQSRDAGETRENNFSLGGRFPPGVSARCELKAARVLSDDLTAMLYTAAVILFVLWLVGWLGLHLLGGAIHICLLLAIICFVSAIIRAR